MAFQPGQSGNPGGRPKEDPRLREAARQHTEAALMVLVEALTDEQTKNRITAANSILDRAYGKPAQAVQLGGDPEGIPMLSEVRWLVVNPVPAGS